MAQLCHLKKTDLRTSGALIEVLETLEIIGLFMEFQEKCRDALNNSLFDGNNVNIAQSIKLLHQTPPNFKNLKSELKVINKGRVAAL